jgi:citrate synthase
MDRQFETALSSHDERSIAVREKDLASEVMDELPFPAALYYLWTGSEPTAGETRLLDAILTSLMVHGTTPSAIAARMTAMGAPEAPQAAVASALSGVGSRFVGSMLRCSEELSALVEADSTDDAIDDFVASSLADGERFPGIGHPHLDPVDPRATRLFDIADDEGLAGDHTDTLRRVRDRFEAATDRSLLINVTGAIAALTADIGLSPTAARGLAVISRAGGDIGHVLEEAENPIGPEIWRAVDDGTTPSE